MQLTRASTVSNNLVFENLAQILKARSLGGTQSCPGYSGLPHLILLAIYFCMPDIRFMRYSN